MATNKVGTQERQSHAQLINSARTQLNYNDSNVGSAGGSIFAQLPQGAFITQMFVEIVTPFNGGGGNAMSIGTNANADNMVAAGAINAGVAGVYEVQGVRGRSFTAADVTNIAKKYTGTGASAGQAEIVIAYEANLG